MGYEGLVRTEMKRALFGIGIRSGATQRISKSFFVLVVRNKSQKKKENTIHRYG